MPGLKPRVRAKAAVNADKDVSVDDLGGDHSMNWSNPVLPTATQPKPKRLFPRPSGAPGDKGGAAPDGLRRHNYHGTLRSDDEEPDDAVIDNLAKMRLSRRAGAARRGEANLDLRDYPDDDGDLPPEPQDFKPKAALAIGSSDSLADGSTADASQEGASWFGSGLVDMVVTNTSQIAGMLQWGENEAPYSLSKDAAETAELKERMVKRLADRAAKQAAAAGGEEDAGYKPSASVADMTMYNRLGVECTASKSKIKQAYYKLALKYHPDKNPNNEEAKQKFQEIGEAYQILFDDNLRQKYDRQGSKAAVDFPMMDASIFFMLLFGCEALEDYIGTLKIAHVFQYATAEGPRFKNINGQMEVEQNVREVTLAVKLAERLDGEVKDGAISKRLRLELQQLCSGTFSDTLVESIGWIYENCGDYFVAEATTFWGLGTTYANIQAAGRNLGNTWSMAKSVVNVALVVKDIKNDQDQEQTMGQLQYIVENVLSLVLYDVENTVRSAATKCCKDFDVSVEQRLARAHALVALGKCMQTTAQRYRSSQTETPDVARKMYDAYVKATQKKDEA